MSQYHAWWQEEKKRSDGLLSRKLLTLLDQDDPAFITELCKQVYADYEYGKPRKSFAWLWNLYLEANPLAKKGLKTILDQYSYLEFREIAPHRYYYYYYPFRSGYQYTLVPFRNDSIRYVKAIYKLAEARQDEEIWAILAYRFDAGRSNDYSKKTRHYLRRRTWRYLRRLGEQDSDDYVRLATKVLLHYREADASHRGDYHPLTGQIIRKYTRLWLFNHLLYHNSQRLRYPSSKYWQTSASFDPSQLPLEREEAFPEIWDRHPEQLFRLLTEARVEPVIEFAGRALRMGNPAYVRNLSEKTLYELLQAKQPARRMFAAGALLDRLDPSSPDFSLWFRLMFSEYAEVRSEAKQFLHKYIDHWESPQIQNIVLACNQYLQEQKTIAEQLVEDLLELFRGPLQAKLNELATIEMAGQFLHSPIEKLQQFAAVPLANIDFQQHPFTGTALLPFLSAKHAEVREAAQQLLNQYHTKLDLNGNWIAEWIYQSSEHNQAAIRSFLVGHRLWVVPFLDELLSKLWVYLLRPDTPEQVQTFILDALFNDLFFTELSDTPLPKILALLEHDNPAYQEFAARLICLIKLDPQTLSFRQLLEMAHHRVAAVRAEARRLILAVPERMTADWLYNLIETDWKDTRDWMFAYIQELPVTQISPDLIYGLLDTARKDVQQLAMQLVAKHEKNLDMKQLMLRGSENPHLVVQEYVLTLAQKFTWDEETLRQMELFFRIVLLRVNRGRKAKKMALKLLFQLAKQKRTFAQLCVPILVDVARNQGVKDFETILSSLVCLKLQYPELEIPLELSAPMEAI